MIPTMADIVAARRRIAPAVLPTPLRESAWLSGARGTSVWLKLECVQQTGSFKIRGALNALSRLPRGTHVATASAGNHGRAIAFAAAALGHRATIFTPRDAPRTKLDAIARLGAALRADSASYDDAEEAAKAFAREQGATFVSPYNHPDVIAGGGTIALEAIEAQPAAGTFVVPIGGGGLIGGIAIAAKAIAPAIRVVGVEVEASAAFFVSRRAGRIERIEPGPTLADGLGGNMDPETVTFDIIERHVDELVTITEEELAEGLRGLVREEHVIAEGAGAAAAAAVLAGKARGRGIVAVVSGANIDEARLIATLTRNTR
jgi:threonine dehydratase